jgi:HTH-type transcriptional regulator, transcriptional repressor of NAD biosynthesis genes
VRRFRHGMVVGSFYPPHAGHHLLIDTAAARCDTVTVVVAPSTVESIPLELRVEWLREAHSATPHVRFVGRYDDTPVDYASESAWVAHCAVFADAVPDVSTVDSVFSSEEYGPELARRFGAAHVAVDPSRTRVPVSGTAVRADPVAHWDNLSEPVRAWLARRVVVLGAESSGTTTLAAALAGHYRARGGVWARTTWVPEYGRVLTEDKLAALRARRPDATVFDLTWTPQDFVEVATEQNAAMDAAARAGSPLLVGDTDALATTVWQERYLGSASAAVRSLVRPADLYLLTDSAGVPFHDDGLRDGEPLRPWMTARFAEVLGRYPHVRLTGDPAERLAAAVTACDALLARGWTFAPRP